MEIIARSDDYQITFHAAANTPSDTLVITFAGLPTGLESEGFGTDFCLAHGYDTIFTAQRINTQYQGLSLEDFEAAVAPKAAQYKTVVCYGPSLGAMLLYTSAGLSTRGSLSLDRSYLLGRTLGIANAPTLSSRIGLYTMSPNQSTRLWSFSIRCSSATKIISRRWWSLFIRTFEKSKSHLLVIPSWFRWEGPHFTPFHLALF